MGRAKIGEVGPESTVDGRDGKFSKGTLGGAAIYQKGGGERRRRGNGDVRPSKGYVWSVRGE